MWIIFSQQPDRIQNPITFLLTTSSKQDSSKSFIVSIDGKKGPIDLYQSMGMNNIKSLAGGSNTAILIEPITPMYIGLYFLLRTKVTQNRP
jgi:hypothetical protein